MDESRGKTYISKKLRCIIFLAFGVSMSSTLSAVLVAFDEAMVFCLEECLWHGMTVYRMRCSDKARQKE